MCCIRMVSAMRKLKLIYNNRSGNRSFKNDIDSCIEILQNAGYDINIFRSSTYNDINNHLENTKKDEYHTIVSVGGDGTLNTIVNYMMKNNMKSKLGIIPAGTANDFARYLKIQKPYSSAAEIIARGNTIKVDVGKASNDYFINVFGLGLITNLSQQVTPTIKNTLGNLAYYLKGIENLHNFAPMHIRIINSKETMEEEIYFLLVLNSSGAGSFDELAVDASVNDGLFNILAVKSSGITELAAIVLKFFKGEHINDSRVIHFKDSFVKLESMQHNHDKSISFETTVDGENGPSIPLEIRNIPSALEVFC